MRFHFDEEKTYLYFEDERCEKITRKSLRTIYICFSIAAFITIALYIWFFSGYYFMTIYGMSMQSTINPDITMQSQTQDCAIVDKDEPYTYGDIIIINHPEHLEGETIIKRVLAFEGDKISIIKTTGEDGFYFYHLLRIKDGSLTVEVVQEDYIYHQANGIPGWEREPSDPYNNVLYEKQFFDAYLSPLGRFYQAEAVEEITFGNQTVLFYEIGEGQIFYLGDNRANSSDARYFGTVDAEEMVVGKVVKLIENGSYSQLFFVRGYYQLKGLFEYFMPKLLDYFVWTY